MFRSDSLKEKKVDLKLWQLGKKKKSVKLGDVPVLHPRLFHSATPEGHVEQRSHPDPGLGGCSLNKEDKEKETNKKKLKKTVSQILRLRLMNGE